MPSKVLIKAVEKFTTLTTITDGVTAPFIFRDCESGGQVFIRHSVLKYNINSYIHRCYIGYLSDQMYPPWNDDEESDVPTCPYLCALINYMFQFDEHLKRVRDNIKSKKDWEYVIEHTAIVLKKMETFLLNELDRQYLIHVPE